VSLATDPFVGPFATGCPFYFMGHEIVVPFRLFSGLFGKLGPQPADFIFLVLNDAFTDGNLLCLASQFKCKPVNHLSRICSPTLLRHLHSSLPLHPAH